MSSTPCSGERAGLGASVSQALDRGLSYYRDRLFLDDGTAKYYDNAIFPIDSQSVAQGIQTFALAASGGRAYADVAWRIFSYARRTMQRSDGAFVFQRRRLWANRTPHIRWTQAPMFLALTHLRRLAEGRPVSVQAT